MMTRSDSMLNFTYNLPTKIIFGKDQIETLANELKAQNISRMLLVYGKQSIKDLGIYDHIIHVANDLDIEVYEEGGVEPNPDINSVLSGQATIQKHNIEFILAAGGGSVIDAAKAMAFAKDLHPSEVWDVFMRKAEYETVLPLGTILTLAATGTETNGNTVISNRELNDKRSVADPKLIPQFSIIDPSYTMSVNKHHTIAWSIDIMMHIFEQYFCPTEDTDTSDYMSLGILKSTLENTMKILNGEDTYQVRANLSWAATLGLSWILQQGKKGDWASHRLSYPITMDYGITHGYALAIIQPAWMKDMLANNAPLMRERLTRLGEFMFDETDPERTILLIQDTFRTFGAAASFKEADINLTDDDAERMARKTLELGPIGNMLKISTTEQAAAIFKRAAWCKQPPRCSSTSNGPPRWWLKP